MATITSLARELNPTGVGEHIYCHPQTNCFVRSELFSVVRLARFPKLGSKHWPEYDQENLIHEILWGFVMQKNHKISARKPDLRIINETITCQLLVFAVHKNIRIKVKESEISYSMRSYSTNYNTSWTITLMGMSHPTYFYLPSLWTIIGMSHSSYSNIPYLWTLTGVYHSSYCYIPDHLTLMGMSNFSYCYIPYLWIFMGISHSYTVIPPTH